MSDDVIKIIETRMEKSMGQWADAMDKYYAYLRRKGVDHENADMAFRIKFGLPVSLILQEGNDDWWKDKKYD